jgi:hypothetical protein
MVGKKIDVHVYDNPKRNDQQQYEYYKELHAYGIRDTLNPLKHGKYPS